MRLITLAAGIAFAITSTVALAQGAPPAKPANPAPAQSADANGGHYSTQSTQIGTLLGDPAAKAVLAKHIPDIVNNPGIDQAAGMTLKDVQQYSPDQLTDKILSEIDADLSKLPAKN
jgi:hypothetical protein